MSAQVLIHCDVMMRNSRAATIHLDGDRTRGIRILRTAGKITTSTTLAKDALEQC